MMTLSQLQQKEVITINRGERLGFISDLEIDSDRGYILAIIIFSRDGGPFFGKHQEVVIPWEQIITIGEDIILVEEKGIHE
ncbi:MAG TPA: YlmC/YmxH family sporulation protein [Cerasibacillus sp.]|uniref:YlmC/YmxH family sporulation protein n=1 Tax=Cerasibacillus sp. TaxID=2498711 RepID=UPI002F423547